MRVVSGKFRGKVLKSVPGNTTRPILDRVKTALFDTLRPMVSKGIPVADVPPCITFLDLFGGSGSVGIEALSQFATKCTFVDINEGAIKTIKENLQTVGAESQTETRFMDAFAYLRNCNKSYDIIFVAPPQYEGIWLKVMMMIAERPNLLNQDALVIVQIDPKEREEVHFNDLKIEKEKRYGNTLLLFYRYHR
jgi:16S rRNA (guanine(966)-N(2))-methyltransferase RsmD